MDCLDAATHPGADGLHGFFLSTAIMWSSSFSWRFDGSDVLVRCHYRIGRGALLLDWGPPEPLLIYTRSFVDVSQRAHVRRALAVWIALRRQERGA